MLQAKLGSLSRRLGDAKRDGHRCKSIEIRRGRKESTARSQRESGTTEIDKPNKAQPGGWSEQNVGSAGCGAGDDDVSGIYAQ